MKSLKRKASLVILIAGIGFGAANSLAANAAADPSSLNNGGLRISDLKFSDQATTPVFNNNVDFASNAQPHPVSAPLPEAFWQSLSGLLGLGAIAGISKLKKRFNH